MRWPDRRPVFADGRAETQAFQLLQRGASANSTGEKLRLPLGDGTLDARRRLDGAALEVIAKQLRGIEVGAQQHRIGQHNRQRPMGIEGRAAGGQGGDGIHVGHFAGLGCGWVVQKVQNSSAAIASRLTPTLKRIPL
ncbi:hypothetical protein D3C86_1151420 [compost metagenome]